MIRKLIRRLTARWWHHEISVAEGVATLERLEAEPGAMEVRIKTVPGLKEHMALCMAELLGDAPNYVECKFDMVAPKKEGYEWITVTVKRDKGKTPHQLRAEAEARIADLTRQVEELEGKLNRSERRRKAIMNMMS